MKYNQSMFVRIGLVALLTMGGALHVGSQTSEDIVVNDSAQQIRVTIDVKDTDIARVLNAFSHQTGISVVVGKEVTGDVTVRLTDVLWNQAIDAILKPYGFGYEKTGEVIIVLPLDKLRETSEAQPLSSKVFKLDFIDAGDMKPIIEAMLSPRGRVQVLEITGQKGWEFSGFGTIGSSSQASRSGDSSGRRSKSGVRRSKSKKFVVTDIPNVLDQVAQVLKEIDTMPKQILIESRFMEVTHDLLIDFGVEYGTGSTGTDSSTIDGIALDKSSSGDTIFSVGAQNLNTIASSAIFGAKSGDINGSGFFNTGLGLRFQKLTGAQFDILIHALEEDINTNTLSAPSIMTIDGQEANILVGTQFPILTASVAGTTSTTTVSSLDYYQDIGVQLRVVPQIAGEHYINMIVHPAVTSISERITAQGTGGITVAQYPVIATREAETQVLMRDGETIMIGGMLQDIQSKGYHKIPILGDIPWLGALFRRETNDTSKVDLVIFITAHIVSDEQIATVSPSFEPSVPSSDTQIIWNEQSSVSSDKVEAHL